MDKLMSLQEVAEKLNLHYRTVLNWVQEGKLEAVKTGRVWRISQQEVEEFLKRAKSSKRG